MGGDEGRERVVVVGVAVGPLDGRDEVALGAVEVADLEAAQRVCVQRGGCGVVIVRARGVGVGALGQAEADALGVWQQVGLRRGGQDEGMRSTVAAAQEGADAGDAAIAGDEDGALDGQHEGLVPRPPIEPRDDGAARGQDLGWGVRDLPEDDPVIDERRVEGECLLVHGAKLRAGAGGPAYWPGVQARGGASAVRLAGGGADE